MSRKYKFRSGKITANLFKITPRAGDPDTATQGDMYVRSGDGSLRIYTGSAWETVSSS